MGKKWSYTEEQKKNMSERLKGHKQTYFGVKMDPKVFMDAYKLWADGLINTAEFRRRCGIKSIPNMSKRMKKLFEDPEHKLDGVYFTDGKPMYASFEGIPPGLIVRPKMTRRKPKNPPGSYLRWD